MKATLINFTSRPLETMCWAHKIMTEKVDSTLDSIDSEYAKEYFIQKIVNDGMPTVMEYVNTVWLLEGVSRELQQQLTRHRVGFSFSIQSMRVIDKKDFAAKKAYRTSGISQEDLPEIDAAMLQIEKMYGQLINKGVSVQNARSILPLGIHSDISFSCSLRALRDMVNKRLCLKTQDEFRIIAEQMVQEVCRKVHPDLRILFGKPCDKGKCLMEVDNAKQYEEKIFAGKQNTDHICPVYKARQEKKLSANRDRA